MGYAKLKGLVPWGMDHEAGLYELAEQPEFTKVLHEEVQARGLVYEDVAACVRSIYFTRLLPSCNRDETIVIRDVDFTAEERAALITFMKVQSKWACASPWREDISGKAREGNVEGL